jgi:predicted TIM-barrel fold metal-dependent hydrolase
VIVDTHIHVWPDSVAKKALARPQEDLVRQGDGTETGAIAAMAAAGIDRAVSLGIAPTPDRVEVANRYAASLDPTYFVGFGSIHPGLSPEENVASLRRHRLLGAKVHPLFQGYALDDPTLWEVFDLMQGEFAVIAHVGQGDSADKNAWCTPTMMRDIVRRFPRLDIVACHFGGYRLLDEVESTIIGLPVYVDTSWPPGLWSLEASRVRRIIERHGVERVLFGSDWPMADPRRCVAAVEALGLSSGDTAAVLGGNAERLLRLC